MTFTIRRAQHYSNQFLYKFFNLINLTSFNCWTVVFDESCRYELAGEDQFDVNKLLGFSVGFDHHRESVRFGWRSSGNLVELSAYAYINSRRYIEQICLVPLNTKVDLFLEVEPDVYRWSVSTALGINSELRIPKVRKFSAGYTLWPYFGGNQAAPHDIQIKIIN
jgi:hypothetical protein